jgi:hypothetical protein
MTTPPDTHDTEQSVEPDKRLTAIAAVLLLLAVAGAWLAPDYLTPVLAKWLNANNPVMALNSAASTAAVPLAILSVPALLCLLYVCWAGLMAWRIFKTGVFPPKGYLVLVKTPVLRGPAARREALKFIFFGLVGLLLLAYLCWSVFNRFPVLDALRRLVA